MLVNPVKSLRLGVLHGHLSPMNHIARVRRVSSRSDRRLLLLPLLLNQANLSRLSRRSGLLLRQPIRSSRSTSPGPAAAFHLVISRPPWTRVEAQQTLWNCLVKTANALSVAALGTWRAWISRRGKSNFNVGIFHLPPPRSPCKID